MPSNTWMNVASGAIDWMMSSSPTTFSVKNGTNGTNYKNANGNGTNGNGTNGNGKRRRWSRPVLFRALALMLWSGFSLQIGMVYYLQGQYRHDGHWNPYFFGGHHTPSKRQQQRGLGPVRHVAQQQRVPSPLEEQESRRHEHMLADPENFPVLIIGGSDGSGTRGVVDVLQSLHVDVVYEDRGTMDVHGQEMFEGLGWPELVKVALRASGGSAYYELRRPYHQQFGENVPVMDGGAEGIALSELAKMFRNLHLRYLKMKSMMLAKSIANQRTVRRKEQPAATPPGGKAPPKRVVSTPKANPRANTRPRLSSVSKQGHGNMVQPVIHPYDLHVGHHRRLLQVPSILSWFSPSTSKPPPPPPPSSASKASSSSSSSSSKEVPPAPSKIKVPPEANKISYAFKAPVTMLLLPILAKVWTHVPPVMILKAGNGTGHSGGGLSVPKPRPFKFLHVVRE